MTGTPEVVIVGAGPVGLMLGCELALAGVRSRVLERLPERILLPKANGIVGQVVRLLDHRGLYQRLGGPASGPQPLPEFFFGAFPLPLGTLEKNPLFAVKASQPEIERVFAERARELGVEIQRGVEVGSLRQDPDGVTLSLKAGSEERELRASFVVGCDGGHSAIRKQLGIAFPGISTDNLVSRGAHLSTRSWDEVMACAQRALPELKITAELRGSYHRTERGCFASAPLQPGRAMINTLEWEPNPNATYGEWPGTGQMLTLEEVRASLTRVLGTEAPPLEAPSGPEPALLRRLIGRNTRLAASYRKGRVFLAGDAAHVHPATGGPGLNLGLQDAANLAWKLAAVVQGWAPTGLLDTYDAERRAAGARVFMQTQAQTALMAPGGDVTALRELFGELLRRPENVEQIAQLMAGSDVRYPMGVSSGHPWVGSFAPELVLQTPEGSRRLAEYMRGGRPLLVDGAGDGALLAAARGWRDRVSVISAIGGSVGALLVRPDGYIAWAAADATGTAASGLREALSTWFGFASS